MARVLNKKSGNKPPQTLRLSWFSRTLLKQRMLSLSYALLTLLVALFISWVLLAKQNFWYGFWHDTVGIAEGIEQYGPQNRYKSGFADTTREQRVDLFSQINRSVHRSGMGLREIRYQSPSSGGIQALLRDPEVVHLQDVANLIDVLFWPVFIAVFLWMGVSGYLILAVQLLPSPKQQFRSVAFILVPIAIGVLLVGPETVFNTLHEWVFPDGHDWFFFYQDSLMSTMMRAPRLFGWIAMAWVLIAVMVFVGLQLLLRMLAKLKERTG